MFGSLLAWGFRGRRIEWHYFRIDKIQDGAMAADGHLGCTKNGHNMFADRRDVWFYRGVFS